MEALRPREGLSPETVIDVLWHEARVLFLGELKTKDQAKESHRDEITLAETLESLRQAQEKAVASFGTKFVGSRVEVQLGRVLQRLQYVTHVGDEAMKAVPDTAGYVWSAFKLAFVTFANDFETCQYVSNAVDQMSDIVFACQIYAKRQMKSVPADAVEAKLAGDMVLEKIPPLLALVMKFAHETRKIILARGRIAMSPRPIFTSIIRLLDLAYVLSQEGLSQHSLAGQQY